MRGRASRFSHTSGLSSSLVSLMSSNTIPGFHVHTHRPGPPPETDAQYAARMACQREEREAAEVRRKQQEAERKAEQEKQWIRGKQMESPI